MRTLVALPQHEFWLSPTSHDARIAPDEAALAYQSSYPQAMQLSTDVIEIEAITATTVTGGLHVFDSEFGEVNGRFDGTLCFSNP